MNEEFFKELINKYLEQYKRVDALDKLFHGSIDSPIVYFGWEMFDKLIQSYFTVAGWDWINYYLLENPERCYYQNNIRVPLETVDDLWNLVKEYIK